MREIREQYKNQNDVILNMARIAKPLTEEQKREIDNLRSEGMAIKSIALKLHIDQTKVRKYCKTEMDKETFKSVKRGGSIKIEEKKPDIVKTIKRYVEEDGLSLDEIMIFTKLDRKTIRRIMDENDLRFPLDIMRSKYIEEPPVPAEYDLTIRSKEEDLEIVRHLKEEMLRLKWDEKLSSISFQIHADVEIGGEFHPSISDRSITEYYEKETHKFDIFIPETGDVILPIKKEEIHNWLSRCGTKECPKNPDKKYFDFLFYAVSRFELIWYEPDKYSEMVNHIHYDRLPPKPIEEKQFVGCTECPYRDECDHTGCKVRGIEYTHWKSYRH